MTSAEGKEGKPENGRWKKEGTTFWAARGEEEFIFRERRLLPWN